MAKRKSISRPRWMKFYPADFESYPAVRICSLAAQGLWIRMLCLMHAGTPAGHLTVNARPVKAGMLAAIIGVSSVEVEGLLTELCSNGVYSTTSEGVIFSRRMVTDAKAYREAVKNGRTGGNPLITPKNPKKIENNEVNPLVIPHDNPADKNWDKLERESERERDSLAPQDAAPARAAHSRKRGSRLPDDWQPSKADQQYAMDLRLAWQRTAEDFRGYWLAKAGKDAVKMDWSLTWQAWCRREAEKRGTRLLGQKDQSAPVRFL